MAFHLLFSADAAITAADTFGGTAAAATAAGTFGGTAAAATAATALSLLSVANHAPDDQCDDQDQN